MDTSATDISFDADGFCNFCSDYLARYGSGTSRPVLAVDAQLASLVREVRRQGRKKRYDCIVGVSGGVDSSWALVKAVEIGLRPLAVHMDNGWNSELAQNNISSLVKTLDIDLVTHVIEWDEYRSLMQAFFDADVLDVELLYDNAMLKINYSQALRRRTRWILSGSNQATEGMRMPAGWNWLKTDRRNIEAIGRTQGVRLRTFPAIGVNGYLAYRFLARIAWIPFLDFLDYNKDAALDRLERDFGFKRYPYKHYESVFTRFYQGHILPTKFGIDKRRLHLSNLVVSDQMTRDAAIARLSESPYPSDKDLRLDIAYFLKKMGWEDGQLVEYLARPRNAHESYPSEIMRWRVAQGLQRRLGFFAGKN